MSGDDKGNVEKHPTAEQPQPQVAGQAPRLEPGMTYLVVPMDIVGDILENFDQQPHGVVKKLEQRLMACQTVANNEKPNG